jgi:hypothetical protein
MNVEVRLGISLGMGVSVMGVSLGNYLYEIYEFVL